MAVARLPRSHSSPFLTVFILTSSSVLPSRLDQEEQARSERVQRRPKAEVEQSLACCGTTAAAIEERRVAGFADAVAEGRGAALAMSLRMVGRNVNYKSYRVMKISIFPDLRNIVALHFLPSIVERYRVLRIDPNACFSIEDVDCLRGCRDIQFVAAGNGHMAGQGELQDRA